MTESDTATSTIERPKFKRGDSLRNIPHEQRVVNSRKGGLNSSNKARTGPHSRWLTRGGTYKSSSREGLFLDACRKELEDHLGGADNITVGQRILIERVCFLRLRAALFDEKFLEEGKPLGELDYRVYMAISNSLVRATRELGLKRSTTRKPLSAILAERGVT